MAKVIENAREEGRVINWKQMTTPLKCGRHGRSNSKLFKKFIGLIVVGSYLAIAILLWLLSKVVKTRGSGHSWLSMLVWPRLLKSLVDLNALKCN